ncbi:MAG: NAD-dependent epimerase/dehydratase family protein [Verrucomicrobiota bacterium]|nr:NAD-dependent epimerase/dehydratase family protein [Verrucomicrobiota bacterium]
MIIFGAGYLGGELARQALARGLKVTALTRNARTAAALAALGADVVVAELADEAWHGQIAGGAEFVVNCVGAAGGTAGYRRSYVEGLRSVIAWARRAPAGTLVYTSSTSVYPQNGCERLTEEAPTDGAGETGQLLLEAEARLRAARDACRRWFILRLAGIYGPVRHRLLDELRAGATTLTGCGRHHLNLIHRDDAVAAVWAALCAPDDCTNEIFNVADDGAAARVEVAGWLAKRLGRPAPEFTGEPADGRRAVTPDRIIDNAKLKARLGWRPQFPTFREGYEKLLSQPGA